MYNFSRFQAKELALAYMSGKAAGLTPEEFFQQVVKVEKSFDSLIRTGTALPAKGVLVKSF
ncbi:hypothetical protein [Acerihabitans arboris]|uniref:Uncharacterized protein n=1 Tax=Acerihabitans arboris TaxID=2691583 RepID=A0A845SMY2_9GAMM|nr:hypothetical protein [Acerihabitans arboris]NDL65379.1 hypothetical protein [Acerihabitans arboris]